MRVVGVLLMASSLAMGGQVHIALGKDEHTLVVQWASTGNGAKSEVMYGTSASALTSHNYGDVREFKVDKGRTWYTRTANMSGLALGQTYYYKVGDQVSGFSDVFKVANRRQNRSPYRHILYGDMGSSAAFTICKGCTEGSEVCDAKTCASNTTVGLVSEVEEADMILHCGDFAYDMADKDGTTGDHFFENIEQIAARVPYMVSHGNHEDDAKNLAHYIESWRNQPSNAVPPTITTENGETVNTMYFSWNFGLVHYISFSSEMWHGVHTKEVNKEAFLKWLVADLKEANTNRANYPWILINDHRPLYSSTAPDREVRESLEEIFFEYGVDISMNGHTHNYERSWPTYKDKTDQSNLNPKATIYVVTGAAGSKEMHTPFLEPQPKWSAFRSNSFGYTRLNVYNASHIHWQQVQTDPTDFREDNYGHVIDDTWIVQNQHGPFNATMAPKETPAACTPPLCRTHDHFTKMLGFEESDVPIDQQIREYRATHGEVAWSKKMNDLLNYFNRNADGLQWEDGLLTKKELNLFKWVHDNKQ
eukprot:TRINITY_DN731_c0_g4_i1.p1 TRINITY_DN731_c0_g4~~TRINITY_DN731_c0_g4_i1.p1  ORF type:complete len:548 (+),score=215.43 TRINITY_DN731_c0_g4_i1:44-1645(+)